MSTQDTTLPPLPDSVTVAISAYGDERADDSPTALNHYRAALAAVREWGAAIAAPQKEPVQADLTRRLAEAIEELGLDAAVRSGELRRTTVRIHALLIECMNAIAAQAQQPATVKESLTPQQAQQAQGVPAAWVPTVLYGPRTSVCWTPDRTPKDQRVSVVLISEADYLRACRLLAAAPQAEPSHGKPITAQRALYFMERFKHEEKLLGPNEQAALDFVIAMLAAPQAEPQPERVPLSDEQIEALPFWAHFVGLFPATRQEITRAIEAAHGIGTKGGDK